MTLFYETHAKRPPTTELIEKEIVRGARPFGFRGNSIIFYIFVDK